MASGADSTTVRIEATNEAATAPQIHPSEVNVVRAIEGNQPCVNCAGETVAMVDWKQRQGGSYKRVCKF